MDVNTASYRRYTRQISLPEIGEEGQKKIRTAKVLVAGAGGLGSASLPYLVAAGVGTIGIVDADRVELSNLNRQTLYETADVGREKTAAARDRLEELNPDSSIVIHNVRLKKENAESLVKNYDIVLDGLDNFASRHALSKACVLSAVPHIMAAVRGWQGQLAFFTSRKQEPCYGCLVPQDAVEDARGCAETGVLGAFVGMLGAWQATKALKYIVDMPVPCAGKLVRFCAATGQMRVTSIIRDTACFCNQ